jgi:16S rRNA (guanine527-N7)-methyltransferase
VNQNDAEEVLRRSGLESELSQDTLEVLNAFLKLRLQWNRTHNLMGPKASREPWQIDVCDGVALTKLCQGTLPLIDVGSGSGVPGLIFSILVPDAEVILVEPLAKRAAFLKTAIHKLGLRNARVIRTRWPVQDLPTCEVVSRAVVSPEAWPALANQGMMVHGIYRYLALKRPAFTETDFCLKDECEYQRSSSEALRLERWVRKAR